MIDYVSVVVPYFNRIHYLKEMIESIEKYADMPYELVVHDDASNDGSTGDLFGMRDKISTLIFNSGQGHQIGLHYSTNRLVKMATSSNIIFLNADCAFVGSCFKYIFEILKRPYVGFMHLICSEDGSGGELKFGLSGMQSGSALAFRKSVWEEVGGWNEKTHGSISDVMFMISIMNRGYFGAAPYKKRCAVNLSSDRVGNRDSTAGKGGYECSYPRIFNMINYGNECKAREHECNQFGSKFERTHDGDFQYWSGYTQRLLFTKPGANQLDRVDWEVAKEEKHYKWKDLVMNDEALKGI